MDMTVNYQLASVLADIVSQATGTAVAAPVSTQEFVSVAESGLKTGYDTLATAISQVLSRTIFSVRPYSAKFKGMMADSIRFGNHVRKLTTIDKPFSNDDRYDLTDGQSVDAWAVNKPKVLQTNFYGQVAIEKSITLYRDQLDVSFSSQDEFGRFIAMIMQNVSDQLEQAREELARNTLANMITGVYAQAADGIAPERVIHLVTEYNTATGQELTAETIKDPDNFPDFARWLFGYMKTISDRLTNRTALYHQNYYDAGTAAEGDEVTIHIMRHTPIDRQKCYLFGPLINNVSSNVLSMVFYDKYLQLMDHESVDFFQNITSPMDVKAYPSYTDTDLTVINSLDGVTVESIVGVIFDEEACGYTQIGEWSAPSPFNSRGGYTTMWYHMNLRYWNDFTENFVLLLLDEAPTDSNEVGD